MKKIFTLLLLTLLLCTLALPAWAVDGEPEFRFALSANGKTVAEVEPGDIVTVSLVLERTDGSEPYTMYGMQDELRYDGSFLELIEGSLLTAPGIVTTDISVQGAYREFYMNYVSLQGGESWQPYVTVGSVQFRVVGTKGISRLANMDSMVSGPPGGEKRSVTHQDVSIVIAGDCVVRFETNGGGKIEDRIVRCGHLVPMPEEPERKGYRFDGWYRDEELSEPWDFENDICEGDMTLYARWIEAEGGACCCCWLWLLLLLILLAVAVYYYRKKRKQG